MSSYKFNDQVTIVTTIMVIHNFIRKTCVEDFEFNDLFSNPNSMPLEDLDVVALEDDIGEASTSADSEMDAVRDSICAQLLSNR